MLAGFLRLRARIGMCRRRGGCGRVLSLRRRGAADFAETCICFVAARPPPLPPLSLFFAGMFAGACFAEGCVSVSSAFRPPPSRRVAPPVGFGASAMFHVEHFFAFIRSGWRRFALYIIEGVCELRLGVSRGGCPSCGSPARRKKFLRRSPKRRKFRKCLI